MSLEILRTAAVQEAAGVDVQRLLSDADHSRYLPIAGWELFSIAPAAGLPERREQGEEVVTYLLAGALRHEDGDGNRSTVCAGGAQRFRTGRGLSHAALVQGNVPVRGIRLRLGLPPSLRDATSSFQQVDADRFPGRDIVGGRIVTIAGEGSPLELSGDVRCYDVHLEPGVTWRDVVPAGCRGLVCAVSGSAAVDARDIDEGDVCFFDDPDRLRIEAREECRLLYCIVRPFGRGRSAA
jgi:redox-sensitive bicupin YhaK (pirin superfamily)